MNNQIEEFKRVFALPELISYCPEVLNVKKHTRKIAQNIV